MEYTLIRSKRKTLALQVQADGSVTVRAPLRTSQYKIDSFVEKHRAWIEKQRQKLAGLKKEVYVITEEERRVGVEAAKRIFPSRAEYFARRMESLMDGSRSGNRKPGGEAAVRPGT